MPRERVEATPNKARIVAGAFAVITLLNQNTIGGSESTAAPLQRSHILGEVVVPQVNADRQETKLMPRLNIPWIADGVRVLERPIFQYASEFDVDPEIVAILMHIESLGQPDATSHAGARGAMQVMPQTGALIAEWVGNTKYHPDQLYDPEINIRYGAAYMNFLTPIATSTGPLETTELLKRIAIGYNGGPTRLKEYLEFGDAALVSREETREYAEAAQRFYRGRYELAQPPDPRLG